MTGGNLIAGGLAGVAAASVAGSAITQTVSATINGIQNSSVSAGEAASAAEAETGGGGCGGDQTGATRCGPTTKTKMYPQGSSENQPISVALIYIEQKIANTKKTIAMFIDTRYDVLSTKTMFASTGYDVLNINNYRLSKVKG